MTTHDIQQLKDYARKILKTKEPDKYTDMIENILLRQNPSKKQQNALKIFVERNI